MRVDIGFIRIILVILLIVYHSFAPFSGSWVLIDGFEDVELYKIIAKLSYSFMLEGYVFISGLVFGMQVLKRVECMFLFHIVKSKAKRLLIPSLFFSLLYSLCFYNKFSFYEVVIGAGHLWFLPMLFWCFIGVWLVENIKKSVCLKLIVLLMFSICSVIELPFRISQALYYLFYFYGGYIIGKKQLNIDRLSNKLVIYSLLLIFIICFIVNYMLNDYVTNSHLLVYVIWFVCKICRILSACTGIIFTFVAVISFFNRTYVRKGIKDLIVKLSTLSFAIYIAQQFILKWLYYETSFPQVVGQHITPWLGLLVTIILSTLFSYFIKKTKLI